VGISNIATLDSILQAFHERRGAGDHIQVRSLVCPHIADLTPLRRETLAQAFQYGATWALREIGFRRRGAKTAGRAVKRRKTSPELELIGRYMFAL
jgi:hypothetical protein